MRELGFTSIQENKAEGILVFPECLSGARLQEVRKLRLQVVRSKVTEP